MSELAVDGGKPAVTIDSSEQWRHPIEEEKKLVNQVLEQGFLSGSGLGLPKEFEEEFRQFVGSEYCLTTDHGHTALASAFFAAGLGPGDEFITPTMGYIGSFAGALHMGARPVFCEIDPKTLLIDPEDVKRRITKRTRVIIPIHLGGNVCDMDALMDIGRRYGITIIDDACHAHGAEWDDKKIGNVGDISCFSLQGGNPTGGKGLELLSRGKPVCGGEGGIVTTNSREFYERQLIYCHLHRANVTQELTNPNYRMLDSEVLGLKYRAHPLALAIAKVSLSTLPYRNKRMRENQKIIFDGIRNLPGVEPVNSYRKAKPGGFYGGYKVLYHPDELDGLSIEKFVEAMRSEGAPIAGGGGYYPAMNRGGVPSASSSLEHLRALFVRGFDLWGHNRGPLGRDFEGYNRGDFPVTESLLDRILTIPQYIESKEGFLDQFVEAFRKVISHHKSLLG